MNLRALAQLIRLLSGERDDSAFRPASLLIGELAEAVPTSIGTGSRRPAAGRRTRTLPEVNPLLLEVFGSGAEENPL